jgi:superoxide dismutase
MLEKLDKARMVIDAREHAYYLDHNNKNGARFIKAFWNIIS